MKITIDGAHLFSDGQFVVFGWALAEIPIIIVQVRCGEQVIYIADSGLIRNDVAKAFPDFPTARNSGFRLESVLSSAEMDAVDDFFIEALASNGTSFSVAIGQKLERFGFAAGNLHAMIRLSGNSDDFNVGREQGADTETAPKDAESSEGSVDFYFHADTKKINLEGSLHVAGWALSNVGISEVIIFCEGRELGKAKLGYTRSDVGVAFPDLHAANTSGFIFKGATGMTGSGIASVVVRVVSRREEYREYRFTIAAEEVTISLENAAPQIEAVETKDFYVHIDSPDSWNGVAIHPVVAGGSVGGWVLAKNGLDRIVVFMGDINLGEAYYGIRRYDIRDAYPDWSGSLLSGFGMTLPAKLLTKGEFILRVVVYDKNGGSAETSLQVEVLANAVHEFGLLRKKVSAVELISNLAIVQSLPLTSVFSMLLPLRNEDVFSERLIEVLLTVCRQDYAHWMLKLVGKFSNAARERIAAVIATLPGLFGRKIFICNVKSESVILKQKDFLPADNIIQKNQKNREFFVGVITFDTRLATDALMAFALSRSQSPNADFIYADERRLDSSDGKMKTFFKPDWSPYLLEAMNYIGNFWFVKDSLFTEINATLAALLLKSYYDFTLALTEKAKCIWHISIVASQSDYCASSVTNLEQTALTSAIRRRGISGAVSLGGCDGSFYVKRTLVSPGLVSIIIPTIAAGGLVKKCVDTIRKKTKYRNFELICLNNMRRADNRWSKWFDNKFDTVIEIREDFNWSRFNNIGAHAAKGEFLLFLNDDIEIIDGSWLDAMLEFAQLENVGVVGARLLYPDRKVQHAGLFLSPAGHARHSFRFSAADDPGYFGLSMTSRNIIGVTGACMLMRHEVFDSLGGFDERHGVVNNDVDFCLRAHSSGLHNIYTPYATLIHHELASRAHLDDVFDTTLFESSWHDVFTAGDPFFNKWLSTQSDDYSSVLEPIREVYAGNPMLLRESVSRILVVKLDHIGDFITGLPAIRRIKEVFPSAEITLLAGKAVCSLAALEPVIDHVIEFNFFHQRSGQGHVEVTDEALAMLHGKLSACAFDIAIDFRKHLDTRHILKYSNARITAGFDSANSFPWLDIALEWEKDTVYLEKRQHVSTDLLTLVDAVSNACSTDREVITLSPLGQRPLPVSIEGISRLLYAKPVVCIHPASGNVMRQWPVKYFAQLADLLVSRLKVHVAIVGGPDEVELAEEMLTYVKNRDEVWSIVGMLKLGELSEVLKTFSLFVGNNSGPQHIAAGLGVPTIAVHSAVISSEEWGPLGRNAIAIRKDMNCSPCYRSAPSDCHRKLACLTEISPSDVFRVAERFLQVNRVNSALQNELSVNNF